jgi:endo-1,4-beta-xylanase
MNTARRRPAAFALSLALGGAAFAQVQTDVPALKQVFAEDFAIGCILSYRHVGAANDPAVPGSSPILDERGGTLVRYHMNSMSPGNNMKAQYTVDVAARRKAYEAASGEERKRAETHPVVRFNGDLVAQLDWARRNGFAFRGHTLVWHSQTPPEFFRSGYALSGGRLSKELMAARMDSYIGEVIRLLHEGWPGLVTAIDVVNEAVDDSGYLRNYDNEWYSTFRDGAYVRMAFESARKYCVKYGEGVIKLYYNDYNTSLPAKAKGIARLCAPLHDAGLLDGIGLQEHDTLWRPSVEDWVRAYDILAPACDEISVTELDVATDSGTNYPSAEVLEAQAKRYAELFACFVGRSARSGRGKIVSVTKDGLNDKYTFVTNSSSSLWDEEFRCKPAFFAVVGVKDPAAAGKYRSAGAR